MELVEVDRLESGKTDCLLTIALFFEQCTSRNWKLWVIPRKGDRQAISDILMRVSAID